MFCFEISTNYLNKIMFHVVFLNVFKLMDIQSLELFFSCIRYIHEEEEDNEDKYTCLAHEWLKYHKVLPHMIDDTVDSA